MHNFMLEDLAASTQAFLVFALFLIPPGYVTGAISNVISFRQRSILEKLLIALVLSVCVTPGLAVLIGRFLSITAAVWTFIGIAVPFFVMLFREVRQQRGRSAIRLRRSTKIAIGLVGTWVFLAIASLVDWQTGQHLYLNVAAYDISTRADFVEACVRTGVPPLNPFFFAHGSAPVMRYFYYWYVLCALPAKLSHLPGRIILIASSAWCGAAFAAMAALLLKHFFGIKENLRRISLYAIALIGITGLDLFIIVSMGWIPPDMEWWDLDQVTSWFDAFLWVPHHVGSLIACLAAFLVLWTATETKNNTTKLAAAIIAAFSFATAAGLSVYVILGFTPFIVLWTLSLLVQQYWADFGMCIVAGLGSLIFAAPYLGDLRGPAASGGGLILHSPIFLPLALWANAHGLLQSGFERFLWRIPMLILHYVFELGFFLIVLVVQAVRDWRRPRSRLKTTSWLMVGTVFCVTSFIGSAVISANDLGWRAAMVMQFMLLLWGAVLLHDLVLSSKWNSTSKQIVLTTICAASILLGAAGSAFQIFYLRTYTWYSDQGKLGGIKWFPAQPGIGERTYEVRLLFDTLDRKLPPSAVLQHDPLLWGVVPYHLYSKYQFAAGDPECGAAFGGSPEVCRQTTSVLTETFRSAATLPPQDLDRLCNDFDVDVLIVQNGDPAWRIANSWVWTRPPLAATKNVRALPCGTRLYKFLRN